MTTLTVKCVNCGRKCRVPESAAGKRGKCPGCRAIIDVPVSDQEVTTPAIALDDDSPIDDVAFPSNSAAHASFQATAPPPVPIAISHSAAPFSTRKTPRQAAKASQGHVGITATQGYIIIELLLLGLGVAVFNVVQPIPKWEYKIESPSDAALDEKLTKLGDEGWELVTARRATSSYGDPKYEMILTRPKSATSWTSAHSVQP